MPDSYDLPRSDLLQLRRLDVNWQRSDALLRSQDSFGLTRRSREARIWVLID